MILKFESLSETHFREDFDCGEQALNIYIRQFAKQDVKRNLARTFILKNNESDSIFGYYTLSSGGVRLTDLPLSHQKKLPKYLIPVARLGRLAVDRNHQGKGYGKLMLIDALSRTSLASDSLGIHGLIIDAKHEKAKQFYEQYGFEALSTNPLLLFAPLKSLRQEFFS